MNTRIPPMVAVCLLWMFFFLLGLFVWFVLCFVSFPPIAPSHKSCEVPLLSQWMGTGLALATQLFLFQLWTACFREIRCWGKKIIEIGWRTALLRQSPPLLVFAISTSGCLVIGFAQHPTRSTSRRSVEKLTIERIQNCFFFFDLAAWLWGRTGRPSVSDLLRLIRVPGGFDPAGQSVCGGCREPTPYQLHHGVA